MQKINLATGEKTTIQLPDLSTAGYSWEMDGSYEDVISVEKTPKEKNTGSNAVGGQTEISFDIKGLKKGKATLTFQQKRSWENNVKAEKEFEITVG